MKLKTTKQRIEELNKQVTNKKLPKPAIPPKLGVIPQLKIILGVAIALEIIGLITMGISWENGIILYNYPAIFTLIILLILTIIIISILFIKQKKTSLLK
ncbi:MAG: hypothetical protein Q4G04_03155 [bacterium]|nr:hypothetical protein [bacterium]